MSLTVTATPYPDDDEPRMRIDLASTGNPVELFTLSRIDPDGRSRPVILEYNTHFTSGAWSGFDYHPPFNQPVSYSAVAGTASASSTSQTVFKQESWLIHRTNPALSVQLDEIVTIADRTVAGTSAEHRSYGAVYPVTRNEGVRKARSGSLTVRADSDDHLDALVDLFADGGVVLMNLAANDGWWDETWAWIQPGDLTLHNPNEGSIYPHRHVVIPYQVVDTPAGIIAPLWTYDTMTAAFALQTYDDLPDIYESYANLVIDYRKV